MLVKLNLKKERQWYSRAVIQKFSKPRVIIRSCYSEIYQTGSDVLMLIKFNLTKREWYTGAVIQKSSQPGAISRSSYSEIYPDREWCFDADETKFIFWNCYGESCIFRNWWPGVIFRSCYSGTFQMLSALRAAFPDCAPHSLRRVSAPRSPRCVLLTGLSIRLFFVPTPLFSALIDKRIHKRISAVLKFSKFFRTYLK